MGFFFPTMNQNICCVLLKDSQLRGGKRLNFSFSFIHNFVIQTVPLELFALIMPGSVGCVSSSIATSMSLLFVQPMEAETSVGFFSTSKLQDLPAEEEVASKAGEEAPNL